jgi:VWFA-related protein
MRALALLCFAMAAFGQQIPKPEAQPSPPTLRITVTLVQVDAVVTDSHGKRVTGLSADDFELLQDGVPQKVTYFSYIPEAEPLPREPEPKKGDKLPMMAPRPITAGQVKRTVALVVDDLALSFDSIVRVRDALRKYIEQEMRPGDLVAIVRTGGGIALLEQFTTDRRLLLEAVDLLKWRFSGRAGLASILPMPGEENTGPQDRPQMLDYGYTLSALGSLGTLTQVVQGMRDLPGRKSVVLLSDSLRVDAEVGAAIEKLTDLANRSNVSIYSVDPRGLQSGMSAAEIAMADESGYPPRPGGASGRGPGLGQPDPTEPDRNAPDRNAPDNAPGMGQENPGRNSGSGGPFTFPLPPGASEIQSVGGLADLAKGTGGLFFANRNDIVGCVRESTADQLGYYLLGYTPAEGTFDKDREKARFHRMTVRVRRPGLRVRWKSGFRGVPDELTLTDNTEKTREQQLLEALASPFAAAGIRVRLTSIFSVSKKFGPFMHSLLYFDAHDLTFKRDDAGNWHAGIDLVVSSYRGVKEPLIQRQRVQSIDLTDEMYGKAMKEGFLFVFDELMKEPGMFLQRVVVRDHESKRLGSASQFVVAPDTRKGRLALSGIMLQLASDEVVRAAGYVLPDTAKGKVEAWSEGGPAVRRYHSSQNIAYGYILINPKVAGPDKMPKAVSQVRVYRNGKPFYTGRQQSVFGKRPDEPTDFLAAGVLHLGTDVRPGEYLIQVTVTDPLHKKKQSQVSQWADFEVVPEKTPDGN